MQDNQETAGIFGPTYSLKTDSALPEQFLAKLPQATAVIGIVQKLSELHEEIKRTMRSFTDERVSEMDFNRTPVPDDMQLAGVLMVDRAFHDFQHLALMLLANTNQTNKQQFFDSLPDDMRTSFGDMCAGFDVIIRAVIEMNDIAHS